MFSNSGLISFISYYVDSFISSHIVLKLVFCIVSALLCFFYLANIVVSKIIPPLVSFLLPKTIQYFKINSFSFYPFVVKGFHLIVRENPDKKEPQLEVKWNLFAIQTDITKVFHPFLDLLGVLSSHVLTKEELTYGESRMNGMLLKFEFEGFIASSPDIDINFFIGASKKKKPDPIVVDTSDNHKIKRAKISYGLLIKRIMQQVLLFVEIEFKNVAFDWNMPLFEESIISECSLLSSN